MRTIADMLRKLADAIDDSKRTFVATADLEIHDRRTGATRKMSVVIYKEVTGNNIKYLASGHPIKQFYHEDEVEVDRCAFEKYRQLIVV